MKPSLYGYYSSNQTTGTCIYSLSYLYKREYIDTLYKVIHRCVMESSNLRLFIPLKSGDTECKILRLNVSVIFNQLNFSDMKNMQLKQFQTSLLLHEKTHRGGGGQG